MIERDNQEADRAINDTTMKDLWEEIRGAQEVAMRAVSRWQMGTELDGGCVSRRPFLLALLLYCFIASCLPACSFFPFCSLVASPVKYRAIDRPLTVRML